MRFIELIGQRVRIRPKIIVVHHMMYFQSNVFVVMVAVLI